MIFRDADDTKAWISEKDTALSTSDYGRDLASVQALQRKHEVLERDLAALEEKVGAEVSNYWRISSYQGCYVRKFFRSPLGS